MRTTLSIDDDVLLAARSLAAEQSRSLGSVISALSREGLRCLSSRFERNGVPLLAGRSGEAPVTLETVNALRDEFA